MERAGFVVWKEDETAEHILCDCSGISLRRKRILGADVLTPVDFFDYKHRTIYSF
jgi:hypothetical protein